MLTQISSAPSARLVSPGAVRHIPAAMGDVLAVVGERIHLKLDHHQTAGACSLWIETVPPGGGPPPHRHQHEDEIFILIDGELTFWSELGEFTAGPGSVVHAPRRVAHTFANKSAVSAKMYVLTTPGGFDGFLRDADSGAIDRPAFPPQPEDIDRAMAAAPQYGLEFLPPPEAANG